MNGGNASGESVFNLPKNCSAQIDIMFHQPHPAVLGPAPLVIIPHHIFIIGIGVLCKESLNELSGLVRYKPEHNVDVVDVTHIHPNWVSGLDLDGLEEHELILVFRGTGEL